MRDNSPKFVLRFLDKVRLRMVVKSHNFDINEFVDELRGDNLDSIHRVIYSFCWRDLFRRRSVGLRRVR
jgi:hypothetical protein